MGDSKEEYAVSMSHIFKSFGKLKALDDVSLNVKYGEIHAILGENGAGKSTLMSILFGMLKPDSGSIYVNGKKAVMKDANDATRLKIGMVHQHFKLVNDFTIYENIVLGCEDTKFGVLSRKESYRKIQDICKKYGILLSLDKKVRDVSVGMQQRTEIVKVLYRNADILIFDEPTAVLTPQEIDSFIQILKNFKEENKAVILITHKLDEIKDSSDTCTVLRRGKTITTVDVKSTSTTEMASLMVGRQVNLKVDKKNSTPKETVLEVKNLSCGIPHSKRKALNNISFKVRAGEIVAIAGIEGNGQEELINLISGMKSYPQVKGAIRFYDIGIPGNLHELTEKEYSDYEKFIDKCYDDAYEIKEKKMDKLNKLDLEIENLNGQINALSNDEKEKKKELKEKFSCLKKERNSFYHESIKKEKEEFSALKAERRPQFEMLEKNWKDSKEKALPLFEQNVANFEKASLQEKEQIIREYQSEKEKLNAQLKSLQSEYRKENAKCKKEFSAYLKQNHTGKSAQKKELSRFETRKANQTHCDELFRHCDELKGQMKKLKLSLLSLEDNKRNRLIDNKNNLLYLKRSAHQQAYLDLLRTSIKTKRNHKLGLIPSDRQKEGLVANLNIAYNLVITKFSKKPFSRFGVLSSKTINDNATRLIETYDIRSSNGKNTRVGDMSGGNQQKVILARETSDTPRLLIANQPTRGLDVGAIEGINHLLIQKRDAGAAILLYSVELEDIMNLADRILVIHNGHISAELDPKKTSFNEIGLYMGGNKNKEDNDK